ncbi:MAG: sel1 repeat family protein, partial [Proteobacteria bacterium]|nr:sel1 repeat family protein [Pseudomonadota bacterium]
NYRPACRALARLYKQLARPLEALQKYSEAIYWGDLEVFVELAQELMREKGPLRISDPDLAVTLYAVAHLLGDQTALSSLNTIADNSNVLAALFSALFYYEDHKTLNFKKVTTHLGLAIEAKHGRAAYMSALIDKKDSEKVEHLSIAISLGYTPAWSVLSLIANDQENPVNHYAEHMLALAERNRGNYETAVLWFERCNESDYVNGIFDYARLHEQGHGAFPKNPKTALSLFDKALSLGLGTAAMAITEMHIRGEVIVDLISIYRRGIECKNNDARDCLLKAVSAGDFGARVVLANLYEVGCEPLFAYDLDSAISLMESLVGESGQSEHIHYLATLYEKRDDIAKQPKSNLTIDTYRRAVFLNNEFALKDLLRLADTDNSYAKIVYAKLYDKLVYPSINSEIPKIISLNRGQAVKYYRNSYPMIEDSLNGLFQIALDDAKDSTTSDAYDALKKFSGQNDALAAFYLAYLHMPQNKLLPDIDKALVYLNHSTGLGYQKALDELKAYASTGNNKAQNLLGDIFRLGKGFQQDSKVAVYWYEMAKNEIVDAKFNLACLLRKDSSVMNAKEAFNLFNQLALQAHANARHNCGEMLERGEGVLANLVMAIAEYTISLNADFNLSIQSLVRLSLLGNAEAAYQLGKYYKSRSNLKTAAEYLSTSAERKHPLGNLEMGYAYENGYAVKKDYPTAILYYEASHELSCSQATRELERLGNNGDAEVQSFVGRYYYSIKQYIVAVDWLTKAANLGHLPGIHQLGCLWIEGGNGIEINNKLGLDWLEAAASKNYVASLIELSEIYILGSIVTQDYSRAARLVKVAIEQGVRKYETNLVKLAEVFKNKDAQFYLGELLETGSYLNPDIGRAYQYYRMAADQNHPYACYLVAYYYFNKQDYKTSYYYINQALKLKHEDARYLYAFHLEKGLGVKEDHLKALDQFEKVNGKHRDEALLRRCESYMRGLGYPKDYNKAFNLCTSIKNDEIAGECMARLYCNDAIPEEYYPRAYKIFSITANPTHPYSRFAKARALLRGEGVRKDNELGL